MVPIHSRLNHRNRPGRIHLRAPLIKKPPLVPHQIPGPKELLLENWANLSAELTPLISTESLIQRLVGSSLRLQSQPKSKQRKTRQRLGLGKPLILSAKSTSNNGDLDGEGTAELVWWPSSLGWRSSRRVVEVGLELVYLVG